MKHKSIVAALFLLMMHASLAFATTPITPLARPVSDISLFCMYVALIFAIIFTFFRRFWRTICVVSAIMLLNVSTWIFLLTFFSQTHYFVFSFFSRSIIAFALAMFLAFIIMFQYKRKIIPAKEVKNKLIWWCFSFGIPLVILFIALLFSYFDYIDYEEISEILF